MNSFVPPPKAKYLALALSLATFFALTLAFAQTAKPPARPPEGAAAAAPADPLITHPYPQFRLKPPTHRVDGQIVHVVTDTTPFSKIDPFGDPPGSNFLPTVYTNMYDGMKQEMPNTLPSAPGKPYNLLDGDPIVSDINPTSPTDDLRQVLNSAFEHLTGKSHRELWGQHSSVKAELIKSVQARAVAPNVRALTAELKRGIDILEGNPIPNRDYSGFPLLHYNGPSKIRPITPIINAKGELVGGNVNVHQIWYDGHIESDTSYFDFSAFTTVGSAYPNVNVTWTITYILDVLNRGFDDFAPATMFFDNPKVNPGEPPLSHVTMDSTFYPLAEGKRTVLKVKMPPPMYHNATYTWGWRQHPPRVQVIESAHLPFPPPNVPGSQPRSKYEKDVFGGKTSEQAIAMIGDLAPEKRMWTAFRNALKAIEKGNPDYAACIAEVDKAREAFRQWQARTILPSGVKVDQDTDITLLFVNNTIYAEQQDGGIIDFPKWRTRGTTLKVTLYNGDYYPHGYMNVDFGGGRGWENQFKSAERGGGSGCQFTFGRNHWQLNLDPKQPIILDPATKPVSPDEDYKPTVKKVFITFNYEPSRRLRFYQFDPLHHDVAIFSLH
jgi:hypothetical protein